MLSHTRLSCAASLVVLAALAACGRKPADNAASPPARRAGLWQISVTRDAKPGPLGTLQVCLDPVADARFTVFGRHFATGACDRKITKDPQGVYHFESQCTLQDGANVTTHGVATGDFVSGYEVDTEVSVQGATFRPMNGSHRIHFSGRWQGQCPSGLRPGDVSLGSGLKVNIDQLPALAAAAGAN